MPFLVWKTINGRRYLVMRWNGRIGGKVRILKEVYIGDMERLASMIEDPLRKVDAYSLSYGITSAVLWADKRLGISDTIDSVIGHKGSDLSPGKYALIFIMNRLSDPGSKSYIERWIGEDYASTIFSKPTSQGFWNVMDRFSEESMKEIKKRITNRLISLGYDFSKIFVDASNFYTLMEENDIAKKGHNKAHRYDLNQISYYIAANYDYIPLDGDSYPGNVHDSRTFPMIVERLPKNAILVFDRGYNSVDNIKMIKGRKYLGALKQSEHIDLMEAPIEKDSFFETYRTVYGDYHRIIVYHSSKLERKRIKAFLNEFRIVYGRARSIMEKGDSDSLEKARLYLESNNMNETILLPDFRIDQERLNARFRMFGRNALFTNIGSVDAKELIDIYRKRNRVEHCFRAISTRGIASPVYHRTP
ncbi:MAG: transposase, partial [Candidatus Micrarchaeaceae archaeon]